jgi:hypothetical protein
MSRTGPVLALLAAAAAMLPLGAGAQSPLRDGVARAGLVEPYAAAGSADGDGVEAAEPISPTRAVLYSLLLPGLGDYALGNKSRASAFFIAEGVIWISYAVFQVQGHQREDEYQSLAVRFAGVGSTGHSDEFYATIRDYDSSEDYEADVKIEGRFAIGDPAGIDPDALDRYFAENRVSDYEPWQWESVERQLQYSEVRSASKTSYRRADYMIAAAAANRLVSAVVAYAAARGARAPREVGYRFDVTPSSAGGLDVSVVLTRSF